MRKILRTLPAIAVATLIAGCGGSDDSGFALSGTAATGAPVSGGDVAVTCGSATAATATGEDGTWTTRVGGSFPCVVKVTGGSLADGEAMYGYATSESNVNVTPLTTLIGAYAVAAADGGTPTPEQLEEATAKVLKMLVDAGFTDLPEDPLTAAFSPKAGDPHDDLIEALMLTFAQQGKTLAEVAQDIATDGELETVALVTPSVVAWDSIADPLPYNMASYGLQAYQLTSLGDRVKLAPGTPRKLRSVTLAMSSWACENGTWSTNDCVTTPGSTFDHEIAMGIFAVDSSTPLAVSYKTYTIPFRPTPDATCEGGTAWRAADGKCYNGKAFTIEFDFSAEGLTLPDEFVYKVTYNTNTYGFDPIGTTGPWDSLNIGTYPTTAGPGVGTDPDAGYLIWNDVATAKSVGGLTARIHVGK